MVVCIGIKESNKCDCSQNLFPNRMNDLISEETDYKPINLSLQYFAWFLGYFEKIYVRFLIKYDKMIKHIL